MSEGVVKPDLSATKDECGEFSCLDENHYCRHCGEHWSDPHAPTCRHSDAPVDERETRLGDLDEEVTE